MSFLLFLRGFIGVLVVFAIATYVVTQSLWTTFLHTMICAVVIQAGYFLAVLALVRRDQRKAHETVARDDAAQAGDKEDQPAGKPGRLPEVPRSRLP
jgi:exopolysaccharide production repressor protein